MIEFIKGCKIPNSDNLKEEYKISGNWIKANVNASKILKLMYEFAEMQEDDEPLFLFLEIPRNKENQKDIEEFYKKRKYKIKNGFYYDIYYLDGISKKFFKELLDKSGEILLNDGMSSFGLGNFTTNDEIGKYKYNQVKLLSNNTEKYEELFRKNNIKRNDNTTLSVNLINPNNPGICNIYKDKDGKDIYKIVENLKKYKTFYKYSMINYKTGEEIIMKKEVQKHNLSLYIPTLEDYWYEEKLESDPETMSYNKGYDVSYYGYHYDTGCIDFPKEKWEETYNKRIKENKFFAYIKDDDLNEFIGYCNYQYNKTDNRYECGVLVEAKYRGKGYSKESLKLLCDEARKNGIKELYDNFEKDRENNTLKIFESVGFKVVKEETWKKLGKDVKGVLVKVDL